MFFLSKRLLLFHRWSSKSDSLRRRFHVHRIINRHSKALQVRLLLPTGSKSLQRVLQRLPAERDLSNNLPIRSQVFSRFIISIRVHGRNISAFDRSTRLFRMRNRFLLPKHFTYFNVSLHSRVLLQHRRTRGSFRPMSCRLLLPRRDQVGLVFSSPFGAVQL
jgi:hypothetical protein